MQEQLSVIEGQGSLALQARAHALVADTYLRTAMPQHLPGVRSEVEVSLTRAVACCEAAEWWPQGEHAATLLALARHACGDEVGRNAAAEKAAAFAAAQKGASASIVV